MDIEGDHQISAEQILKEVYEKRKQPKASVKVDILDLEELKDLQRRKRTEYETYLKRNRLDIGQWIRYAQFEVDQHDLRRARSIFERALLVDNSYIPLWIRYIDVELRSKYINHARNLLNSAVNTLPRVDKLWYKYLIVEESLGNVEIVRSLFIKWLSLEPNTNAWDSFVDFEIRQEKWENVRDTYSKYVLVHPGSKTWLKWIGFESKYGTIESIRKVYSFAVDTLASYTENSTEFISDVIEIVIAFASWEALQEEYERSRALYLLSIEKWPQNQELKNSMVRFEKTFGDVSTLEGSVILKRKRSYAEQLKNYPRDYDTWWLYLDLIEENFTGELKIILEASIKDNTPKEFVKSINWERYICLWIRCLTYIELKTGNMEHCRDLYKQLIYKTIPHDKFTFPDVWILFANFEVRQNNILSARKILGTSLGMCPEELVFRNYIDMEIKLKEFDRTRKLYEKYIEFKPSDPKVWIEYSELEENLGDEDRARGIYTIALNSEVDSLSYDSKLAILKRFITFETDSENYNNARKVFELYLNFSGFSTKVWIEYALYESSTPTDEQVNELQNQDYEDEDEELEFEATEENINKARIILERAISYYKEKKEKDNRIVMLEALMNFENLNGNKEMREKVSNRMPTVVKKKNSEDNIEKEYLDFIFPDDAIEKPNISKILDLAKKWDKEQKH